MNDATVAGTNEVATPKLGISNILLLITVTMSFIMMGDKMGHENNWTSRMAHVFGFIPSLMKLSTVEWSQVGPEIKDVDPVEYEEIKAHLIEKFDIIDDKLEEMIEAILNLIADVGTFVMKIKKVIVTIKGYLKK